MNGFENGNEMEAEAETWGELKWKEFGHQENYVSKLMLEPRKLEMGKVLGVEDRLKIGEEFINVGNEGRKKENWNNKREK